MFFVSNTVKVLATCSKTTQGRTSTWHFCQDNSSFFALRTTPKAKVLNCKDLDDLRTLYKKLTGKGYGFVKV